MSGCNQNCDQGRHCVCAPAYRTNWRHKVLRTLIHFDILVMRTFLGGKERETISAAAWNAKLTGKFFGFSHHIIDLIFLPYEREHCKKAWNWQRELYK